MSTPTSAKLANLVGVADLIAASSTFQTETGASTAAAARKYVHIPLLRPGEGSKPLVPCAILQPTKFEHYRMAGGGQTYTLPRGTIKLFLGRAIRNPAPEASEDELIDFTNWEEAVLVDVLNSAGLGGQPNLTGAEMIREPAYTNPQHESGGQAAPPFYSIEYLLLWDAQYVVALRTKIFETKPPDVARDAWRDISRAGMQAIAEFWHTLILPDHFTPVARYRYRHKLRRRKYIERKQKMAAQGLPIQKGSGQILLGGQVDNVLTGHMMQLLKGQKAIRAFPSRVTVEMFGPRYVTMRNWKMDQPDKAKEITTLTGEQNKECAIVGERDVNDRLARYRAPQTETI